MSERGRDERAPIPDWMWTDLRDGMREAGQLAETVKQQQVVNAAIILRLDRMEERLSGGEAGGLVGWRREQERDVRALREEFDEHRERCGESRKTLWQWVAIVVGWALALLGLASHGAAPKGH
jgi:hypothetical protein